MVATVFVLKQRKKIVILGIFIMYVNVLSDDLFHKITRKLFKLA